jgi:hypothetical protein
LGMRNNRMPRSHPNTNHIDHKRAYPRLWVAGNRWPRLEK